MGEEVRLGVVTVTGRIVIRPHARADAEEIYSFLAKRDVAVARRFNEAVADTLIALRQDPHLGIAWQARNGRLSGLHWKRVQGFRKYLVFYQIEQADLVVERILHGARDLESIFG